MLPKRVKKFGAPSPHTCCRCCCSHINSHNQVRGHRTGSSHSGAEEYSRGNTHNPRWYTHISQLTQFMPPPETYKSEIGSQSTMCQVQAGAYVSLFTPGETKYSDCHPRKTTTYILHVVSITAHTHDMHKDIGEKETKKRKEDKGKEREEKKNETRRKRQSKRRKRQERQEKTRQESKERRRENMKKEIEKEKKEKCHTSRP